MSKNNIDTEKDLLACNNKTFTCNTQDMLTRVQDSTVRRAYLCLEKNGNVFAYFRCCNVLGSQNTSRLVYLLVKEMFCFRRH